MRVHIKLAFSLMVLALLLALSAEWIAAQYSHPDPDRVYAIKAGKLVDPEKGTTETNQIILVRGRKIESVGSNLSIPSSAKVSQMWITSGDTLNSSRNR